MSNDGKFLISCSWDRSIKIFDIDNKNEIHHFRDAHEDRIYSVAISPDSRWIVTGSADKSLKVFDLLTEQQIDHFQNVREGY